MAPLPLSQRVWLQAMLAHGVVSQAHAKALQKRACEITRDDYQAGSLPTLLEEVGKHLSSVGLEIRQARDEFTGAHLIMIVNAKGDELAQVATTHSATEIAVTKKILERIFTNNDAYSLSSTEALKIGRQCKPPLGNAETEMLLSALVKEGWLRYNRDTGRYLLTSRSMMELNVYLKNAYPEHYFSCIMCEDPITNGVACSNAECRVRVHKHCQTSYERQIGISTREGQASTCRGCQHTWSPSPVGEASVQR
ncbi:hypothetical protein FA10DRAFT_266111 [Acaromyces ingoldii]|uniref:Non-structural maintenance of chromosomes element 1 homolog n=1 Tax=Acaromyces ingoldii TaxID=215250 RepID=A0A316YSX1_9BASI|nr:hypothetical protein FA10DRAFT_266111 [Acaromyces ingoldii]PWN92331.1 hypothetical protein FA10DRAFT_266111 [Acaromyces ingoldii]